MNFSFIFLLLLIVFLLFYLLYSRQNFFLQQKIDTLRDELTKKLADTQNNFSFFQKSLVDQLTQLYKEIGNITQESSQILTLTKSFSDILKPTKKRAIFGEVILGNLLKDILPQDIVISQYSFRCGKRVDFLIKLPQGYLPIDAKFSLDVFRNYQEAPDSNKESVKKAFIESVKRRIEETAGYILPDEGTLDFSFMYVPSEAVYYSIISETGLCEYAQKKRVFIVGPNSLYVYLQTLLLGMKALKIEEKAKFLYENLKRLEIDIENIVKEYMILGNHLRVASNKYEEIRRKIDNLGTRILSFKNLDADKD